MKYSRILALTLTFLIVGLSLSGCSTREYPRPTEAFYINDYAEALDPGTHRFLRLLGEELFESTKDTDIGGFQFVVATIEVDTLAQINEYDVTQWYREWRIGENDMGVLTVLFFETRESLTIEPKLLGLDARVGYNTEPFLTPTRLGLIANATLWNEELYADEWMYPIDIPLAHFAYETVNTIYDRVYDEVGYDYDLEEHRNYLDTYSSYDEYYSIPMEWWILLVYSLLGGNPDWGLIGLITLFFALSGGFGIFVAKGAGGSSGGGGIFRRK